MFNKLTAGKSILVILMVSMLSGCYKTDVLTPGQTLTTKTEDFGQTFFSTLTMGAPFEKDRVSMHQTPKIGLVFKQDNCTFMMEPNASELRFLKNGDLVMVDVYGNVMWRSNTADRGPAEVRLLHNLHFGIFDAQGNLIWQRSIGDSKYALCSP